MEFQYGDKSKEEMDKIQKQYDSKYGGPQNNGKALFISDDGTISKIDLNLERRSAIKSILDRWSLMTISVEDAEKELTDLLASKTVGEFSANLGACKFNSPSGMAWDLTGEIDGHPMPNLSKLVITIETGKRIRLLIEGAVGYVPQAKKGNQ